MCKERRAFIIIIIIIKRERKSLPQDWNRTPEISTCSLFTLAPSVEGLNPTLSAPQSKIQAYCMFMWEHKLHVPSISLVSCKVTVWLLTFNFIHFMAAFWAVIHNLGQWFSYNRTWFIEH
jgi:hypothetical protein